MQSAPVNIEISIILYYTMIADRMKNIYKLWDRKDVNPNLWNENKLPFSFLGIPANNTIEILNNDLIFVFVLSYGSAALCRHL